jgi:4-diphosphocytidyl-2-C-methyl-D-erythritol kinase
VLVRALAKVNLCLEVLNKRADGFHNLRTIFQTISLADTLTLTFTPGGKSRIELDSDIPNNLALRAADSIFCKTNPRGQLSISLSKHIPMGGGLGGGSSDAAAVLLALPVLTGRPLAPDALTAIAAELGSDVAFFLLGGTALGLGRGTELYPLPDAVPQPGLIVTPDIHVFTPEAYAALNRTAEAPDTPNATAALAEALPDNWHSHARNDFEPAVFARHPEIRSIRDRLRRAGASLAMMTGSGASVFALFDSTEQRDRAARLSRDRKGAVRPANAYPVTLVTRRQYQRLWCRQLAAHIEGDTWPPRSRYAR